MSEITMEQLVEKLGEMTPLQLRDLTTTLEEKWGVKASPVPVPGIQVGPTPGLDDIYEEPTEFAVILIDGGPNKIQAIKVVRELTGLALKEAKDLVETAPKACIKDSIPKTEAHEMKARLEAAGCKVELR